MTTPASQPAQQAYMAFFGRPGWSYPTGQRGPVWGPYPRLSIGTGRTGEAAPSGQSSYLPGYLSSQEYVGSPFGYDPQRVREFQTRLPRTINTGDNGRQLVGTYEPHDFTPADRFLTTTRAAPNWQVMEFPAQVRDLLAWQQAQRYQINALTRSARPLDSSSYFLGYQVQTQIQAQIGATGLGYMGSM